MAHVSQKEKKEKLLKLKPLFAKYGIRATLSINHHSTLLLNIWESRIDFIGQYNTYKINNPSQYSGTTEARTSVQLYTGCGRPMEFKQFEGESREFLLKANQILQEGNFDNSDSMTDYFHVGFYSEINIGNWEKDFIHNPNFNKKQDIVKIESLELVKYSEKAIALFGNTKPIKEKLKELGGRFNPFLTKNGDKMAGWIFKKEQESQLLQLIS